MMKYRWLLVLLSVSLLPACSLFTSEDGTVTASVRNEALYVTNETDARVYYFAVGREAAALIFWVPSLDRHQSVAKGRTTAIPFGRVNGREEEETEVLVYWWHAVQQGRRSVPGEIHSVVVEL